MADKKSTVALCLSRPPTFEHGAAGLVSTVDDYLAFARMLLADGRHRGQPLLTPASAKAMKTNHLTASQRAGGEMILGRGRGWGYGMAVVTEALPDRPAAGSFGWIGGYGSSWISDPSKERDKKRRELEDRQLELPYEPPTG